MADVAPIARFGQGSHREHGAGGALFEQILLQSGRKYRNIARILSLSVRGQRLTMWVVWLILGRATIWHDTSLASRQ